MKIFTRFFVFCILVLSIIMVPQTKPTFNNLILNFENITYFFYTSSVQKQILNEVHINNGNFEIVSCNADDACILKTKLTDILGESVRICNASTEQKFKILDIVNSIMAYEADADTSIGKSTYNTLKQELENITTIIGKEIH